MNARIWNQDGEWWIDDEYGKSEPLRAALKHLRLARGMSVSELERLAGVDHPTYFTFEKGTNRSVRRLPDIIDALGLELRLVSKGTP